MGHGGPAGNCNEGGGTIKSQTLNYQPRKWGRKFNEKESITWPLWLPNVILILLAVWHLHFIQFHFPEAMASHIGVIVLAIILGLIGTHLRGFPKSLGFLEKTFDENRGIFTGLACIVTGGIYFISFSKVLNVYLLMGFMVLLLAYIETSQLAISSYRYCSLAGIRDATSDSLNSSLKQISFTLGLTFVISVVTLLLSLLAIVGFRGVWTVLIFAVISISCLAVLIRLRSI